MVSENTLLVSQEGVSGNFHRWLKDLGLERFITKYPVEQLVRWGWLVPQSRIIFPVEFFVTWENYPAIDTPSSPDHESYSLLWDSTWITSPQEGEQWPLHPFFRTGSKEAEILSHGKDLVATHVPETLAHPNGRQIRPYADFFFHWQAYALIDVIGTADCIEPILFTPDVVERAKGITRIAEYLSQLDPPNQVLTIKTRWGGLQRVMTWISHYRSFVTALYVHFDSPNSSVANERDLIKMGAVQLARELGITADILEEEIESRLLVQADRWMHWPSRTEHWCTKALTYLQKDISHAVSWLCQLNGKRFEEYLKKWSYTWSQTNQWAQLSDVLPWESWAERCKFLQMAPLYLKNPALALPEHLQLAASDLETKVDALRLHNYPFRSFIGAFKALHDHLHLRPFSRNGPDFRNLRPLDYYSLVALRAEGVLQHAIDRIDPPAMLTKRTLEGYIVLLAERLNLSPALVNYFSSRCSKLTQLYDKPADPIRAISQLQGTLDQGDIAVAKAFLCCVLARNYFAHHYYLDGDQLPKSEGSAFLLGGILTTVLLLAC